MRGLIYNVTYKVEIAAADAFFRWMAEEHVINVLKTGMFDSVSLTRVRLDEKDGETFAYQFKTPSEQFLHKFTTELAPDLDAAIHERFPNQFVHFSSILEVIDEYNVKFT